MMWERRWMRAGVEEGERLSEEAQRERGAQVEKVFRGREMGKGCLERWLPTSSSDAPVTSSGQPTAITHL